MQQTWKRIKWIGGYARQHIWAIAVYTLLGLAGTGISLLGSLVSKDLITYVADRKGHDRRYAIAPDKIKAEIGWEPETMFKEGIRKTIQWFFEHEEWMKNVTSGDYQKYYAEMYQ